VAFSGRHFSRWPEFLDAKPTQLLLGHLPASPAVDWRGIDDDSTLLFVTPVFIDSFRTDSDAFLEHPASELTVEKADGYR
jgi:hypothetical protein